MFLGQRLICTFHNIIQANNDRCLNLAKDDKKVYFLEHIIFKIIYFTIMIYVMLYIYVLVGKMEQFTLRNITI